MIGSLIGAGIGAVGSIYGGIKASEAMKRAKEATERQRERNRDWYNRRYNEDSTQRGDARRVLTATEEALKQRNKAASGAAAVMGATEESVATEKAVNNQVLSDATSQVAAMGDARKDNIEATYMQNDAAYQEQLNNLEVGKAHAIGEAVKGVTGVASELIGG